MCTASNTKKQTKTQSTTCLAIQVAALVGVVEVKRKGQLLVGRSLAHH
jgi:hypothetical protein